MPKTYPAVELTARHGRKASVGIGVVLALLAIGLYAAGGSLPALACGLVLAGAAWALARLGAEIVEVVAETLLPR
jgi:hypothetical protein